VPAEPDGVQRRRPDVHHVARLPGGMSRPWQKTHPTGRSGARE
jgi:hypothetical protein